MVQNQEEIVDKKPKVELEDFDNHILQGEEIQNFVVDLENPAMEDHFAKNSETDDTKKNAKDHMEDRKSGG